MKLSLTTFLAGILAITSFSSHGAGSIPDGWFKNGSHMSNYKMGIDEINGYNNSRSAFIESISENPEGFSTMMQNASVDEYRGKRIQMTVFIQSTEVSNWSGAWLRIDSNASTLAFDNMENRSIKGSTDWQPYSIVLDVPEQATKMAFGVLLSGKGKVRFDNFNFEVVDNHIPVTNMEIN